MEVDEEAPSTIEEAQALSTKTRKRKKKVREQEQEQEQEPEPEPSPEPETKIRKKKGTVHATIQVVTEKPDKVAPLVGYFPSGYNPIPEPGEGVEVDEAEQPRVRVFRHEGSSKRIELVVSPNGWKGDYVGTSYEGEGRTPQVCTSALGIFDKATGTLKIVPIWNNKILRLDARFAVVKPDETEPSSAMKGEFTAEKKAELRRELTERYGTKRSITQAKKLDSLKQEEDPNTKDNLDRKIKEVHINKDALESAAAPTARNIPPYDSSATTPEQAFPLDKIILSGEWNYLLDILELLQGGSKVAPDAYPSFVRNRFDKLGEVQDEEEQRQLACILSYITHLIKFKDQHSMDGASAAKQHKIPSMLRQKFFTMFADSDSKRLPDEKCALLIHYVLVLTLFADQFRTNPSDIAKDLRMSPVTLRVHFEHLGCKLRLEKKTLVATLPLPLKFPTLRQRRRR